MVHRNFAALRIFVFALMLVMLFSCFAQQAYADAKIIRILDGRITTEELWNAFDNGQSHTGLFGSKYYTHYRYRKADKTTGWKRVNGNELSSTVYAENIVSNVPFTVLRSRTGLGDEWEEYGTYQFQTYYNIGVTKESFPSGGNVQITGGILSGNVYQVNEDENLTLRFTPVEGYDAQVQVNNTAWVTVDSQTNTYHHQAQYSTQLKVRYTKSDASKHRITIHVNDPRLGTYSGIANDQMNSPFRLVVTPYNEKTGSNDQDAYVKSVRINDVEVTGTYANTVLTLPEYNVVGDTTVEIEFAKRLILKAPTVSIKKYEEDPFTLEYSAKMNMDKAVSKQITAIEDSILESVVDMEETAGYDRDTVKVLVQGVVDLGIISYEGCMEMSNSVFDLAGIDAGSLEKVLNRFVSTNWGDISFGNDSDEWENICISMPGNERYPAVETPLLTVVISEARTALNISGIAEEQNVESQSNIDAAVRSAVYEKILADNHGITAAQLNASGIACNFTAPDFEDLSSSAPTNVTVQVTIPKGDLCLYSAGTITVPVKRNAAEPTLTVESDGHGVISYTRDGYAHTITVTPDEGYYVRQLQVTTTPYNGSEEKSTVGLDQMTALKDTNFTRTYLLQAKADHSYRVKAFFAEYKLSISPATFTLPYYDGLYANTQELTNALSDKLTAAWQITPDSALPQGTYDYVYLARSQPDVWLPVETVVADTENTQSPHYGCHKFGAQETETIRLRYEFAEDGFSVVSNTAAVTLLDERPATVIRLKKPDPIEYADYQAMSADDVAALLFDGVYAIDGDNQQTLLPGITPDFSPALDSLPLGTTATITATFAGNADYRGSTATTTLTIQALPASISLDLSQKVVQHGGSYNVSVSTQPAGLRTIQFIAGLDLAKIDMTNPSQLTLAIELALLAPDGLGDNLDDFVRSFSEGDELTLDDLNSACNKLKENQELCAQYNISIAAIESLQQVISMYGSFAASAPLNLSTVKPSNTGLYICGAIIAEGDYQSGIALDYLLITPEHYQMELGWKNEISGAVSIADLSTAGLLDAKVISVESGMSIADAQHEVTSLFLGFDKDFSTLVATNKQEELVEGSYVQIASTANMINQRYSCQPIVREIAVANEQVFIDFLDAHSNPISELVVHRGEDHGASLRVTYGDGTPVPQEKLDQYLQLVYFIFDGLQPTPVENVTKPGLYIVHASYMEKAADGSLAAAGNGSMFLFFSEAVKGFSVSDNTVEYDGNGHFATVTDTNSPALTTASVIVDKAEKQINILLPESLDTLEEMFASVGGEQFDRVIEYLEQYSPKNTVIRFVRELLRQAAADIAHTTGYTIAINAELPSDPGEYHIYVAASGQPVNPADSETASAAMLERALLTITPSKPVISLRYAQDPSKVYDGEPLADPVKGADYTINGAYRGNESIAWYLQTADGPVAVDAPTDVGSYNVTITLEATEWNEAASASLSGITITPKDIADADVALVEKLTYNGSEQTQPVASVTVDGLAATYTVSGNNGMEAGDYVLTVHGTGNFTGMAEKEFSIAPKDIAEAVITLEYTSVLYDGDVKKPAVVSAAVDGIQMLENTDFTVSYASNTDPGVAQVILNGKNNFTGTASATFVIYRENEYTVVVTGGQGSGAYKAGEAVTITADVPAGYEFIRWKGIEGLQFTYGSSEMPTAVFSMPARHVTIAAEYGMIQPQTFTVRFSAGSGSGYMVDVTVTAGEYRLPACAFTAPDGQQFSHWRIGSAEYNPGDTIIVGADTLVTAVWKQLPMPGSAPVILSPTQAQTITLSVGGRATLAITAQDAWSYQWYVDRGDGQGPVPVPGAEAAAHITPPAVIDDDGSVYFCVVKNEYGFVQSVPFRLIVQPQAVVPTTGDNAPLAVWCAMLLGSLIGFVLICRRGKSAR